MTKKNQKILAAALALKRALSSAMIHQSLQCSTYEHKMRVKMAPVVSIYDYRDNNQRAKIEHLERED